MQNISSADFYSPTTFNGDTKNQIWMSIIADGHDSICNCFHPFAHLLASIFPPGHKDRDLTINQILQRDYKERCHSGGGGERSGGGVEEEPGTAADPPREIKEEEEYSEGELTNLINAAENAQKR